MLIDHVKLTVMQENALKSILDWYEKTNDKFFVLGGYAGTGKSTIARRIGEMFPHAAFCAYTGKAAHVLREKGVNATTIHSLLYKLTGKEDDGSPIFKLRSGESGMVIVDEYSMLDSALINDITTKCARVLFLGDPAQLPPIKEGKSSLSPNVFLTEIHRQALDNPIVKWAHEIRNGNIPRKPMNDGAFVVLGKKDVQMSMAKSVGQIIVGKNTTRKKVNELLREEHGFSDIGNLPVKGDKLICLQNNHREDLFNGMIFDCEKSAADWNDWAGTYEMYVQGKTRKVWDGDILGKDPREFEYRPNIERFDYAYAVTCHKAQGSEFPSVLIYDEAWGEQKLQWLYTAVTRAKDKCILAI